MASLPSQLHLDFSRPFSLPTTALLLYLLYFSAKVAYRLLLSPIAKFPGPKLAAATYLYEIYYDLARGGDYINKIEELHKQYGPILRINPHELHISQTSFYAALYTPSPSASSSSASALKRHKHPYYTRQFGTSNVAGFATVDHDLHRLRRKALDLYFSKRSVRKLEGLVRGRLERFLERVRGVGRSGCEEGEKGKVGVRVKLAATCFATDVISEYATGRSYNYLDRADFFPEWSAALVAQGRGAALVKPFPWLIDLMNNMPLRWAHALSPGIEMVLLSKVNMVRQIRELQAMRAAGQLPRGKGRGGGVAVEGDGEAGKDAEAEAEAEAEGEGEGEEAMLLPTVFHEMLASPVLPEREKSVERLAADCGTLIGAGAETTGSTIGVIVVYVLSDAEVLGKLKRELAEAMPEKDVLVPLAVLEKLPYLNGVIKEGLRLTYGVCTRLQRIADVDLQFNEWTIPAGTPVGMSSALVNKDPSIWPEPLKFRPERWLDPDESARLYKYMVSFTKGSRSCLGINLAYAELYMAIAALFRRFEMRLCDTSVEDVQFEADWFIAKFKKDLADIKVYID